MEVERIERDGYTDITIRSKDAPPWSAHRITCMDMDIDDDGENQPPVVYIAALTFPPGASIESLRRLAREYDYVADIAERLQAEKQAAYHKRFSATA
jgi:hypothetical protein